LGHDGGRHLYDTPGLLSDRRLYGAVSAEQLREVVPVQPLLPIVHRLVPGKTLLLGHLARLDYLEGRGHLLFTTFLSKRFSSAIKPTSIERADRLPDAAALRPRQFVFDGDSPLHGWNAAWTDVSFGGLGWISVTGRAPGGPIRLAAHSLAEVDEAETREPLMPYEAAASELKRLGRRIVKHGSVSAFRRKI
jgi:hypothetical protein